ncbi:MAG: hypothetical protein ACLR6J_14125 [Parabacteroides merdae]
MQEEFLVIMIRILQSNHGVSSSFATLLSAEQKNEEKLKRNLPVDKLIIGLVGSIEKEKDMMFY